MKRFAQVSLMFALALSSIPTVSSANVAYYRETVYYQTTYSPAPSPFGDPMPLEGNRVEVGWERYYCDGTVRSHGLLTGDWEEHMIGDGICD